MTGTALDSRGQRRVFRFHSSPLARCNAFHNSILGALLALVLSKQNL